MSLLCASWAISFGNKILQVIMKKQVHLYEIVFVNTIHSFGTDVEIVLR